MVKGFYEANRNKYNYSSHIRSIFKANGVVLFPTGIDSEFKTLHVWTPRRPRERSPLFGTVAKYPAIEQYFEAIKAKKRNNGYISPYSIWRVLNYTTKFLNYLGVEITDHVVSDLIKWKQKHPSDFTMEDKLLRFSNLQPISTHRHIGHIVLGAFRENKARLHVSIDFHLVARTKKISGFITTRAALRCRHCMNTIDLAQVEIWRRIKSYSLLRLLHAHHFFWVTCPNCKVKARYDIDEDVKELLSDS